MRIYFTEKLKTASREALLTAAELYTGGLRPAVAAGKYGKPYFPELPDVHFSVSHSGGIWMCAFSEFEVGLDLQKHAAKDRARISKRFFAPEEDEFLQKCGYERFFDVWCAKESYIKYTGEGLLRSLRSFSTVDDGAFPETDGVSFMLLPWRDGWSLCLCTDETRELSAPGFTEF